MEKKRSPQKISEEFKLSVIRDYYSSGMSQYACVRKYHLNSLSLLPSWLKKYGPMIKPLFLPSEPTNEEEMSNCSKESYREENAALKNESRSWRKQCLSPEWRRERVILENACEICE